MEFVGLANLPSLSGTRSLRKAGQRARRLILTQRTGMSSRNFRSQTLKRIEPELLEYQPSSYQGHEYDLISIRHSSWPVCGAKRCFHFAPGSWTKCSEFWRLQCSPSQPSAASV